MTKIFYFQKRNLRDGTLLDDYFDVEDEKQARGYYNSPRHYAYVGWSDGRFMIELKKNLPALKLKKDSNGLPKDVNEVVKNKLRRAQADDLEFAKTNPDKTPPRDLQSLAYARAREEANFKSNNPNG